MWLGVNQHESLFAGGVGAMTDRAVWKVCLGDAGAGPCVDRAQAERA
jgi:hypothetical protein